MSSILKSFNLLPKVLGMLTFGAFIVIHRSNYLSESQIDVLLITTLIQWNITIGGKMARGAPLCPRVGQNGPILYFIFLYLKNIIIHTYISWLNTRIVKISRFLPNIMIISWIFLTWDQFYLSYAILPRLPLHISLYASDVITHQWPLLLTWFNFNLSMDK